MTTRQRIRRLAIATLAAAAVTAPAHAATYVHDARLLEPTASTHYSTTCHDGRPFTRTIVLTARGHRFGPRHVRANGDVIWRDRRGHGRVKFTHRNTVINRSNRTILFVAVCSI